MRKQVVILIAVLLSAAAGVLLWTTAADYFENRNFTSAYIAWKHGRGPCPSVAELSQNLVFDPDRSKLVEGLTREQLRFKFGNLLNSGQADFQMGYEQEPFLKAVDHAWIGETSWIIYFVGGRATELVILKG